MMTEKELRSAIAQEKALMEMCAATDLVDASEVHREQLEGLERMTAELIDKQ